MDIPPVNLSHLRALTDHTGLLQHSKYGVPNPRFGYTTDDNLRALLVATRSYELTGDEAVLDLARTYTSFLHWMQRDDGLFHNEMSYDRHFLDDIGSPACQARAVWVLGTVTVSALPQSIRNAALYLLQRIPLKAIELYASIHVPSFIIYGLSELREHQSALQRMEIPVHSDWEDALWEAADALVEMYARYSDDNWRWFLPEMTWGVAAPCAALFRAYELLEERRYLDIALQTYEFMCDIVFEDGIFQPIGCKGWFRRDGRRAYFDQQPIEAMWMFFAACNAHRCLRREVDVERASLALGWFIGINVHNEPLYDPTTGACYDGLHESGLNLNQGAEATVSCLLTLLTAHMLKHSIPLQIATVVEDIV